MFIVLLLDYRRRSCHACSGDPSSQTEIAKNAARHDGDHQQQSRLGTSTMPKWWNGRNAKSPSAHPVGCMMLMVTGQAFRG